MHMAAEVVKQKESTREETNTNEGKKKNNNKKKSEGENDDRQSQKVGKDNKLRGNGGEHNEVMGDLKDPRVEVGENMLLQNNDRLGLVSSSGTKARKDMKKRYKEKSCEDETGTTSVLVNALGDNKVEQKIEGQKSCRKDESSKIKKMKKAKKIQDDGDAVQRERVSGRKEIGELRKNLDENTMGRAETSTKEKKTRKKEGEGEKGKVNVVLGSAPPEFMVGTLDHDSSQVNGQDGDQKKKRKKEKKYEDGGDAAVRKSILGGSGDEKEHLYENTMDRNESSKKEEKLEKKERKEKDTVGSEGVSPEYMVETVDNNSSQVEGNGEGSDQKNKKRKKEKRCTDGGGVVASRKNISGGTEVRDGSKHLDVNIMDGVESSKKEKKKKEGKEEAKKREKNSNVVNTDVSRNGVGDQKPEVNAVNPEGEHKEVKRKKRKRDKSGDSVVINSEPDYKGQVNEPEYVPRNEPGNGQLEVDAVVTKVGNKDERKRKRRKRDKPDDDVVSNSGTDCTNQVEGNVVDTDASGNEARNGLEETPNMLEKSKPKWTSKRATFSQYVDFPPSSEAPSHENAVGTEQLVQGKRFSLEEDEMVKEAVLNYINSHQLGEGGIEMVLHCRKHKLKNCWKDIGAYLPWRPYKSVYYRAHTLFERDDNRTWTPEECELVRNFYDKHGADWKTLAGALGKHKVHVKDAWRRVRLTSMKRGAWSQDEYQTLFDLVNTDLRMKATEVKKSKHGMLRDNISWMAISTKLQTRTDATCCAKWYGKLTSPMVAEGKWYDTDDYRLLIELYDLNACCIEDVDWDSLFEHRPGDICRKRWNQMVRLLGEHENKPFSEQVEVLINRYCPDVLEAREAYNSNTAED